MLFGEDYDAFVERYFNPHAIGLRKSYETYQSLRAACGMPPACWDDDVFVGTMHTAEYLAKLAQVTCNGQPVAA